MLLSTVPMCTDESRPVYLYFAVAALVLSHAFSFIQNDVKDMCDHAKTSCMWEADKTDILFMDINVHGTCVNVNMNLDLICVPL